MKRKKGSFHAGTSGWSYSAWKGNFYPDKLPAKEWLQFYAKHFDCTEINTSFYHLPKEKTVFNWTNNTPDDFMFCPKLSRYITHMKKLKDCNEPLQKFFDVFHPMIDKMGPVLIQLPKMVTYNPDKTDIFFKILKGQYPQNQFALEVRHESWYSEEAINHIRDYNIGMVISQSGKVFPYEEIVTGEVIYLRFHGPGALYASKYSEKQLMYYVQKIKKWIKEGHEVWAFFNNDWFGYAVENALQLKALVEKK